MSGRSPRIGARSQEAPQARTVKAVKWWAAIGALMVALQIYVFTAWFVTGNATPTERGPSDIPTWMLVSVRAQEVACPILMLLFFYFFLIKPWRREHRLTPDGIFILCMLLMYWMDPMLNYAQNIGTYNSYFINLGSWSENIPGWIAPNSRHLAEPLLWAGPSYVWALFGGVVLSNIVMRKAKERWPRIGTAGLVGICFAFFFVVDTLLEIAFLRLGIFIYAGTINSVSLFAGHYYQFPIVEPLLWGATWAGWACVRYFRNDRGETVAERGVEQVQVTSRQKSVLRLLANLGMLSTIFMTYNVTWAWVALHQDAWPKDVTDRSYFVNEMCGDGTDYACPGPEVPIPRPDSAHIGPDGQLVPADSTVPDG